MSKSRPSGQSFGSPRWPGAAAMVQYGLPFALVLYLALRNGGYDQVVWGSTGVAVWWLIALGAVIGLWPAKGINRGSAVAFGLFTAFTLWTLLALIWTDSSERTTIEAARAGTYLGILALSLLSGAAGSARRMAAGSGAAIALVALLAALSRFEPSLFPESDIPAFLPEATARLSYPLNYWNGLAALLALGAPLILHMAVSSKRAIGSALWSAALPLAGLVLFMTISRGGGLEALVAITAYVAIRPRRLVVVPVLALAAVSSAVLIWFLERRDDLADGLATSVAESQGHEMLAITVVVLGLAGLGGYRIARNRAVDIRDLPVVPTYAARRAMVAIGALAVIGLIAAAASGEIGDRWEAFKSTDIADNTTSSRLESSSGNGRYQYWDSSLEANSTAPLTGTGPGTWEFWWAENGTITGFVRDAHSLYFEVLAEAGVIGLLILLAFFVWVAVVGVGRAHTAPPALRADHAAILGAGAAFLVAAGIDWTWEQPVLPATFMLLASAMVGPVFLPSSDAGPSGLQARDLGLRGRLALGIGAALVALALAVPYMTAERLDTSEDRTELGDLPGALDAARDAQSLQPFAASPRLQEALVLEQAGLFEDALPAATEATEREPTNWRTWYVLSQIEAQAGMAEPAAEHKEKARSLNPRSPLFATTG